MKNNLILTGVIGAVGMFSAFAESFEPPNYQVGQNLDERSVWSTLSPVGITVVNEEAAVGEQSLKVSEALRVQLSVDHRGVKFYQFYILPTYQESALQPAICVDGAAISFLKTSEGSGAVAAYPSRSGPGTLIGARTDLTPETWVHITVRVDAEKGIWDIYVNGLPFTANQKLSGNNGIFVLQAIGGDMYFDDYSELEDNPLFEDGDRDGIPDSEEKALGLNAFIDDRAGDLDGDGVSNVDEFFSGEPVGEGGLALGRVLIYVDNFNGNDANSGLHSYVSAGLDGPLRSIGRAMDRSSSGGTIFLLKGKGVYDEGVERLGLKDITIVPLDSITLK